jgi:hypothetical protein
MNFFEKLKAYDFERNQICDVLQIVTSNLNGRNIGEIELNNSYVTFWKNHLTKECIILNWTGQWDSKKEPIYCDDLLENDETIFRVEWNQQQTCWWLNPIINKKDNQPNDGFDVLLIIGNQKLGNGYFSRKDLTKIGNYWTDKQKFNIE